MDLNVNENDCQSAFGELLSLLTNGLPLGLRNEISPGIFIGSGKNR
jgi:hypothetical protein